MTLVKNDREFAVDVVYQDADGNEVTKSLAPGEELELAEEQVEAVQKLLADAVAPQEEDEDKGEDEGEGEEGEGDDEKNLSEADKIKRENAELKARIRKEETEKLYQTALSEGKIVPAQEEAFRALADAVHGQHRQLSDGTQQNLSEVLADFVAKAPKVVSLNEENGKNTDDTDKGPAALSEETKQGLAKMGVSEEAFLKYGNRESVSVNELANKEN